jgi:DNA-binding PadR family transcriptional regulator
MREDRTPLSLGEWACLGILYQAPAHGFAVAARLKPTGDVGRVWSLSRPLTYRALDQLTARGYVRAIGEEPGIAGGNRTILAGTRAGRAQFRRWLATPVEHMRDLRSELLLKLVLADMCELDIADMLDRQYAHIAHLSQRLQDTVEGAGPTDVVAVWRSESSRAALRFLERVGTSRESPWRTLDLRD